MVDKATDTDFLQYFPEDKKPELYRPETQTVPGNNPSNFLPKPPLNGATRLGSAQSKGRSSPTKNETSNGSRPLSAARPGSAAARPQSAAKTTSGTRPQSAATPLTAVRPPSATRAKSSKSRSPTRTGSPPGKSSSPVRTSSPNKGRPASGNKKSAGATKSKSKSPTLDKNSSKPKLQSQSSEITKPKGPKVTEDGLKILDMSSQGMTTIPSHVIAKKDLGELNLSCNNLRSLPLEIHSLIYLRKLDLSKNGIKCMHEKDFSGIPAELGQLQNLRELYISECNLPFIPPAIWTLHSLTVLDVSRNKINVLLPEIGSLSSLKKLNLQQTSITSLPSEIAYCQELEELLLYGNAMESLPETLADMPKLRLLAVNYRSFCNIVDSYMENLIQKGQINSEHIPLVVFELPALENLDLESTKINTVPEMYMEKLQEFSLRKNFIYEMPDTICKLYTLKAFDISKNFIKRLPPDVSEMTNLTILKVNDNMLEKIPTSIGKLVQLEELEMGGNKLRVIPTEIKYLSKLKHFVMDRNNIQALPEEICTLRELETLDVTQNSIKQLPILLYNLTKLTVAHCYKGLRKHGLWVYQNPITQPPARVWKTDKPQDIFNYLKKLQISQTENLQRQKMLIIGSKGAGKSALMDALVFGRSRADDEPYRTTRVLEQVIWRSENGVNFLVYDLAGDEIYRSTYSLFLDPNALVLLVYDSLMYAEYGYDECIGKWLDLLNEHTPGCVVKIVCARSDLCFEDVTNTNTVWQQVQLCMHERKEKLEEELSKVQSKLGEIEKQISDGKDLKLIEHQLKLQEERLVAMADKPLRIIPDIRCVCIKEGLHGIQELLNNIEICSIDKQLFPHAQRYIPDQWHKLCTAIKKKKKFLFLEWNEVEDIALRFKVKDAVVAECIQYLHDIGEIFWFRQIPPLNGILFHRPRALVDVICTMYRHDMEDFLTYDQSKLFSSKGGLMLEEFEHTKDIFVRLGQISRQLLKCLWFYLGIDKATFAEFLDLLPKLSLCYTIPEPLVPQGKCYLTPLLVVPWLNREKLNQIDHIWSASPPMKTKQVVLDFSFPFSSADVIFVTLISQAQDLLTERTDWQNAVIGKSENESHIFIRKYEETDFGNTSSLQIYVRGSEITGLRSIVTQLYSLMVNAASQRPGLYWRLNVDTENCKRSQFVKCFLPTHESN